jgi:hypothetical protein
MFLYKAFGLGIGSEVALPELPVSEGFPDILIRREIPSRMPPENSGNGANFLFGYAPGGLKFVVRDGEEIIVYPEEGFDEELLRTLLLGSILATLLRQRGYLVLHACGLARDGYAFGFVGDSGWGKSTMAELFYQHGYTVLHDDLLAIDTQAADPAIIPGYPQIRLRQQAGVHLRPDYYTLPTLAHDFNKRVHLPKHKLPAYPLPLRKLYFLEPTVAAENAVVPLSGQEAIIELVRHTRVTNLITAKSETTVHFKQCAHLIQSVPLARLKRIRSLDLLPQLLALVEEDLQMQEASAAA